MVIIIFLKLDKFVEYISIFKEDIKIILLLLFLKSLS